MKVLFAVNNENISESIVKKYQKEYKEIISYKNVYYFNAILKEIQKDKSYDRIVISEDLEPFANNNYDTIDKFLFEKLDNISDEATCNGEADTPIILICTDRRAKGDNMLIKLFGIGIYSAVLGQDRSIDEVCKLLNKPRIKKEAKIYYKIDSDDVNYQSENESDVSELEIQNILSHYKRLGKNEDRYVDSFNNIASQYTDAQLKVIIKFLPLGVKAVLEANSPKYQELVTFASNNTSISSNNVNTKVTKSLYNSKQKTKINNLKLDILEQNLDTPNLNRPVIIPSAMNISEVKKLHNVNNLDIEENDNQNNQSMPEPVKRGRGRPKKVQPEIEEKNIQPVKRGRGRPKKVQPEIEEAEPIDVFSLANMEEEQSNSILPGIVENDNTIMPGVEKIEDYNYIKQNEQIQKVENYNNFSAGNLESVLTRDKKIVSFVGTTKNGTSFIINNLAQMLSTNVSVAILDMTENRNSYYIYTKNEENLRRISFDSIEKLRNGIAEGIKVNRNLTVYTALPGENKNFQDVENILKTLVENYSLVLIDCDFKTPHQYFALSQEIYIIQSMDVLTIQPATAFLRDLKAEGILGEDKIKVVINKEQKVRNLSSKVIVGGLAFYNDPAMSFMTELFNKDTVGYYEIPYDEQVSSKYLEALVNCDINLSGYPKMFIESLKRLSTIVYPLLNKQTYSKMQNIYNNRNTSYNKIGR